MNKKKGLIFLVLAVSFGLLAILIISGNGDYKVFNLKDTSNESILKEPEIISVTVEPISANAVEISNVSLDGKVTWKDTLGNEHTNVYVLERAWSELHLSFQPSDSGVELDETLYEEVIHLLKQHYGDSHTYIIV